ncbi:MAG: TonB-dependent receptor [Verrucomicrobiota bacterium]
MSPLAAAHKSLIALMLALASFAFVSAVEARVPGSSTALANTSPKDFDIKAQLLSKALTDFGLQSGLQISAEAEFTRGKTSEGVKGRMSSADALSRLLQGSGLKFRVSEEDTILVEEVESGSKRASSASQAIQLASITVKGELRERDLQDTQTSVAVIRGEKIERRSDDNFEDVLERTAGISNANGDLTLSIRGVEQNGPTGGGGAAINIKVDGASITGITRMSLADFSTWDLEQVEVLRGPQSTQSGRNSIAGAVVVRSKDPVYDTEFKARTEVANGGTWQVAAAANAPIVEGKVAVRVAFDESRTDGFVTGVNVAGDEYDSEERATVRAAIRLDPTESLSAILKYTRFETVDGTGAIDAAEFPDRRVTFATVQERNDMVTDSFNLRASLELSDQFILESESNYFENDTLFIVPIGADNSLGEVFEQELKVIYEGERVQAVVGAFYTDISTNNELRGTFGTASFFFGNEGDISNYALFGEADIELAEDLFLTAGLRYDEEEFDNSSSTEFFGPLTVSETSGEFDALLPKLGIRRQFGEDRSLGFTIQRGYRAGGAGLNFFGIQYEYDPEYTTNYELAYRSELLEGRVTLNANVFYTDWTDQQLSQQQSDDPLDTITVNAGESRLFGGELELQASPNARTDVFASLAYVDTEFTDYVTDLADYTGNEFPTAPAFTASIGGEYAFAEGFFAAASASYTDGSFRDIQNTPELLNNSRFLLDGRLGYRAESWEVFGYLTNALDEDYWNRRDTDGTLRPGDPRQYGIVFSYRR